MDKAVSLSPVLGQEIHLVFVVPLLFSKPVGPVVNFRRLVLSMLEEGPPRESLALLVLLDLETSLVDLARNVSFSPGKVRENAEDAHQELWPTMPV